MSCIGPDFCPYLVLYSPGIAVATQYTVGAVVLIWMSDPLSWGSLIGYSKFSPHVRSFQIKWEPAPVADGSVCVLVLVECRQIVTAVSEQELVRQLRWGCSATIPPYPTQLLCTAALSVAHQSQPPGRPGVSRLCLTRKYCNTRNQLPCSDGCSRRFSPINPGTFTAGNRVQGVLSFLGAHTVLFPTTLEYTGLRY
ncbi:hypothetical protein F4803DRAFT_532172 [Xylaria telfairii]|nr:hypothetical protein F4803DRAFT_532172 [Xylaria telfairii]